MPANQPNPTAETDDSELSQPDTEPLPFDEDDQDALGDDIDANGMQVEEDFAEGEGAREEEAVEQPTQSDQTARANAFLQAAATMEASRTAHVPMDAEDEAGTPQNDSAPPSTASPNKTALLDDFSGESELTEEEDAQGEDDEEMEDQEGIDASDDEEEDDELPGTQPVSPRRQKRESTDESESDSDHSEASVDGDAAEGTAGYAASTRRSGRAKKSSRTAGAAKGRSNLRKRSNRAGSRASTADVQAQLEDDESEESEEEEEEEEDAEEADEAENGLAALATEGGPGAPAGLAGLAALATSAGTSIDEVALEGYDDEEEGAHSRMPSSGVQIAPNASMTSSSSTAVVKGKKGRGASMIANAPLLIVDPAADDEGVSRAGSDEEREEDEVKPEEEEEEEEVEKGVETPAVDPDEEVPAEDDTAQRRIEALETLAAIEIKLAALRDRLYLERIEEVKKEGEMILNGTHPELIHLTHLIDARKERRMRLVEVWLENEERQFENTAKTEEEATWSVWKDETASLRRSMMDDTSTKKRRLDREKRSLDVPQPARRHQIFQTELIPNPAYEGRQFIAHAAARRAAEAERERGRGRGRRRGKRKHAEELGEDEGEQAKYDLAILQSLGVNAENLRIGEFVAYPDLRGAEDGDAWADLEAMGIPPQQAYGYYRTEQDVGHRRHQDTSGITWEQQQEIQQQELQHHYHDPYILHNGPTAYDDAGDYYASRQGSLVSKSAASASNHKQPATSHANGSNGRVQKDAHASAVVSSYHQGSSTTQGSRKKFPGSDVSGPPMQYQDHDTLAQHPTAGASSSYPRAAPQLLQQADSSHEQPSHLQQQRVSDRGQLVHPSYSSAYHEAAVPRAPPSEPFAQYRASLGRSQPPATTEPNPALSHDLPRAAFSEPASLDRASSHADVKMEDAVHIPSSAPASAHGGPVV